MNHGHDFWSFIPFILSSVQGKKINWMRIAETIIGAIIISIFVSYVIVQKMEVKLTYIEKTLDRHEYELNLIRNKQ